MMSPKAPPPEDTSPPSRLARRGIVLGGVGVLALGAVAGARWFNVSAQLAGGDLTAPEAHRAASSGEITLIDIRRPDEWARTGLGAGAVPIDMRRGDFVDALLETVNGKTEAPLALICARGVRSAYLAGQLRAAGFSKVADVPEGMLGSGAGPGWLRRGLPVVAVGG